MSNSLSYPPLDYQHQTEEEDWSNGGSLSGPAEGTAMGESECYIHK